jgi:uncharacterized membrane protein
VLFTGEGGAAVLALLPTPEPILLGGHQCHVVLVPTAPVPFGGGLFFVPAEWIRPASFGVEGLTSIYVSMGISAPQHFSGSSEARSADPSAEPRCRRVSLCHGDGPSCRTSRRVG